MHVKVKYLIFAVLSFTGLCTINWISLLDGCTKTMLAYSSGGKRVFQNLTTSVGGHGKYTCREIYCGGNKTISDLFNRQYDKKDVANKTRLQRFPGCIGIGLPKSGTTAMLKFLSKHPGIAAATQEIHFFSNDKKYSQGLSKYLSKMPSSTKDQVTYEKSPLYGVDKYGTKVVNRIYVFDPSIKMLFMVRNPIAKAISGYLMFFARAGLAHGKSFEEFVIQNGNINEGFYPVTGSRYSLIIKPWLEKFRRDQIHVIDGDVFIQKPHLELQKIERFLHLDPYYREDMFVYNQTKGFQCFIKAGRRSDCLAKGTGHTPPDIDPKVIQKLRDYYKPYNEEFYHMTGQHFNWD